MPSVHRDRLGLLVIDEAFDCWKLGKTKHDYAQYFNAWWKKDLEAMVKRDRNHPSIIMWSIGNEIVERGSHDAVESAAVLRNAIKQMDTTRPITSAVVNTGKDWYLLDTLFAQHDVAGYNYQLHSAPVDHQRVPGRIIVHTESYPRDAFANWKLVQNNSYIIGDFVWTAIDYLGEAGIGRNYFSGETPGEHWENDFFPWHGAYCGDIDLTGWRKPIAHYRGMLYNNNEKLYMAIKEPNPEPLQIKTTWWSVWPTWESWNWPGFEGRDMEVEVYSKYPSVRLYLNGKLIGEKLTSIVQEYKAVFAVPYLPGTLKAVAVENNKEVASAILQTAGDASTIKLTADKKAITADGQDLLYVSIEITDKAGVVQPNADNRLHIEIDGPGTIMGIDNANLKDTDSYTGNSRNAWHGRALAVIRSTLGTGNIKLKVSSPGLTEAVLQVQAVPGKMN
jgi:beta-galactosidase